MCQNQIFIELLLQIESFYQVRTKSQTPDGTYKCCNSINMTSNSKLMTHKEETHKIQKEKN